MNTALLRRTRTYPVLAFVLLTFLLTWIACSIWRQAGIQKAPPKAAPAET